MVFSFYPQVVFADGETPTADETTEVEETPPPEETTEATEPVAETATDDAVDPTNDVESTPESDSTAEDSESVSTPEPDATPLVPAETPEETVEVTDQGETENEQPELSLLSRKC